MYHELPVDRANNPQARSAKLRQMNAEYLARRPLVVTSDPVLLDELLRLCAAAGVTPVVAADADALTRGWAAASLVLLDPALAGAARHLPRRTNVVIVGSAGDPLWEMAVEVGADQVAVLPAAAGWLVGLVTSGHEVSVSPAPLICVMGGQGGGGATTFASALGRCASSRSLLTVLIDADPFGGGIDLALGMESAGGERWPALLHPSGHGISPDFVFRLPARESLRVLSAERDEPCAVSAAVMADVVAKARRDSEFVIVDLPRRIDATSEALLSVATTTFLVLPAQVRAVAAASALAAELVQRCPDVRAVIRGPAPSGLSLEAISRSLGIPLAGALGVEPGLVRDYERGIPPGQPRGPLAKLCAGLLEQAMTIEGRGRAA
jgi:secretion/DNA translocation related CpaE-like protein